MTERAFFKRLYKEILLSERRRRWSCVWGNEGWDGKGGGLDRVIAEVVEINARYFTRANKNKLRNDGKATQHWHLALTPIHITFVSPERERCRLTLEKNGLHCLAHLYYISTWFCTLLHGDGCLHPTSTSFNFVQSTDSDLPSNIHSSLDTHSSIWSSFQWKLFQVTPVSLAN